MYGAIETGTVDLRDHESSAATRGPLVLKLTSVLIFLSRVPWPPSASFLLYCVIHQKATAPGSPTLTGGN